MGQVTVFSGPERRRRWSDEERLQILAEVFSPGTKVADVCRRYDISTGLIYTWRRKLLDAGAAQKASGVEALPAPVFAEAVIEENAVSASTEQHRYPAIIVDLPHGKRLSVFAAASPALVAAALKSLR